MAKATEPVTSEAEFTSNFESNRKKKLAANLIARRNEITDNKGYF